MFPRLGLLQDSTCPYVPSCQRKNCLYSHVVKPSASVAFAQNAIVTAPADKSTAAKRSAPAQSSSSVPKKAKPNINDPKSSAPASSKTSSSSSAKAKVQSSPLGPPRIASAVRNMHTPINTRNAMLKTFYEQFNILYSNLERTDNPVKLAYDHALAQEASVYAKTNKYAYRNQCILAISQLKKRTPPSLLEETGTNEDYQKYEQDKADRIAKTLNAKMLIKYGMNKETLQKHDYVVDIPATEGGSVPDADGTMQKCDRCSKDFKVTSDLSDLDRRACSHHPGRLETTKIDGVKTRVWSCCSRQAGLEACTTGPHIFVEKTGEELHQRVAFIETSTFKPAPTQLDIIALDCELIATTAGLSLARVTLVSEVGDMILDELIRPQGTQIDLLTRFSGITEANIDAAVFDIYALRDVLAKFIGPQTFLIGHGLENDMKALRLVHTEGRCIDTAQLYPHPHGLPFRNSLRNLAKSELKTFIQENSLDYGHDSSTDAKISLELLRLKVMQDAKRLPTTATSKTTSKR